MTGANYQRLAILVAVTGAIVALAVFTITATGRPQAAVQNTDQARSPIRDLVLTPPQEGSPPTLTEFGDFQCPHCAAFALSAMPEIRREFIGTRLIEFEYRHYPFLGPASYEAAEASECARDQGLFHHYHDALYQAVMNQDQNALTARGLEDKARAVGLNLTTFSQCVANRTHQNTVEQDKAYGRSLGVRGTPSLFLGREKLNWNSYQHLRSQLQDAVLGHDQGK